MRALYPASHDLPQLGESKLALKIARHSSCTICQTCSGLRPPPGVAVALDDKTDGFGSAAGRALGALAGYGSDDDEDDDNDEGSTPDYLTSCSCGHGVYPHGASKQELGPEEFARRAHTAVRLDELLQDAGKLLDFDYIDDDISSLRMQMAIPLSQDGLREATSLSSPEKAPSSPDSSTLSEPHARPSKRRKLSSPFSSSSSLSTDDDEDQPLANTVGTGTVNGTKRGEPRSPTNRTHMRGKKAVAQNAPISLPPPTEAEMEDMKPPPTSTPEVKVEDAMDEDQISRLANGVTVDTTAATSSAPGGKPEKMSYVELRKGIIKIVPVYHDGKPHHSVICTGLKTLFQKQLPNMPREYIARTVYDSNSRCLAIIKRGYKVVGGICFRPFPHRGFAEIVFFATHSVDQVKGYGGMLMDHFKAHVRATYPGMNHLLTYADNYAVGYFKKQGFSKEISLDRSVWAGYIKDYEGATILQCTMVPKHDYLRTKEIIALQREAILEKIREMSKSHIVYSPLPQFLNAQGEIRVDPKDVPGLRESGWSSDMTTAPRIAAKNPEHAIMRRMLTDMQNHTSGWPFVQPVNADEVADYYEVVKNPMDFSTMEHKLDTNQYPTLDSFVADAQLIFDNCRSYNPEDTVYHKCARRMDKWLKQEMSTRVKKEDIS